MFLCCYEIAAGTAISETSLDTDKEILLNLKSFLLNDYYQISKGQYEEWNQTSSNPCDWYGIYCSPDGERVTGIDLSDNGISGLMFNNFSALTQLQYLDLSKNTLGGAIPDDLNRCHNLVYLNLSYNLLEGELNLSGLTSLEKLDLSANWFLGDLKLSFPSICNNLVVANLSENNFIGRIDTCFDGCRNLQYLDLSTNHFIGNIWTGFSRLVEFSVSENNVAGPISASMFVDNCSLLALDLSENKFQGEVPREISNCKNLVVLNLWGNNFTGSIPSQIGSISTLEALFLGGNRFSRVIPESLLNLKNLASLDLSRNSFGGQIQEIFGRFTQLKSLVLQGNSYTGGIYSSGIHRLPNISNLDLSYNNLSGHLPVEFSQMPSLKFLILAYNQFTGPIPLEYGNLSVLQGLDLSFNRLSGSIPPSLGKLSSLLWLMLAYNSLTGEIPSEIGNCASLLWINLAHNQLSGAIPREVTNIGRNATPTFESNRKGIQMMASPSNCLVTDRLLNVDKNSPFRSVTTTQNWKDCRSKWDRLLRGYGIYSVCLVGSSVRTYEISGYIQLSGNQLTGELPRDIGKMQNFRMVYLGSNEFYGKLPREIGNLPLLDLNISWNRFSGEIPEEMGNMRCLSNLDLSRNNFSGAFPTQLNNLNELSHFNISFNPLLSGQIPKHGQLAIFGKDSFLGNPLLHSPFFNLDDQDQFPPISGDEDDEVGTNGGGVQIKWEAIVTGYGCGMVLGVAMLYLSFRKGEPNWYLTVVDGIHMLKAKRLEKKKNARRRGNGKNSSKLEVIEHHLRC
ncbi:hypothetical protein COLO4_29563 [Corchorus olitorius]|uniref:Leucine-rich repeat-containing N-terminal plant-type domain-containing protein n=1 Tax=Corchorus olitorius TaxID=93759 RepID=A0A1R3HE38_9ROSI|nr:hypothetical protein COLO4_29563 [Corchorus olitorius]